MKAISLTEHKQIMLDMLVVFTTFCDKHNLAYYLDAGTLIGAVRHKGFIPWDDDIDINMPIKDYDSLIDIVRRNNNHINDYIIVEFPADTIYPYLKISDTRTILIEFPDKYPMAGGIYMDLFPKYGIKDKSFSSKMVCEISKLLGLMHWVNKFSVNAWQQPSYSISKRLFAKALKAITWNSSWAANLQDKFMHNYMRHHPLSECEYVTTLTNGEFHKLAPKSCFDGYQMLEFEGHKFKGPKDYDTYLHCLYKGDYMQLPPEDKRVHHNINVYWK